MPNLYWLILEQIWKQCQLLLFTFMIKVKYLILKSPIIVSMTHSLWLIDDSSITHHFSIWNILFRCRWRSWISPWNEFGNNIRNTRHQVPTRTKCRTTHKTGPKFVSTIRLCTSWYIFYITEIFCKKKRFNLRKKYFSKTKWVIYCDSSTTHFQLRSTKLNEYYRGSYDYALHSAPMQRDVVNY